MTKIMQIFEGRCHYDMTYIGYKDLADARAHYAPDIIIVEAPNKVFEGWEYDETKEGDARFIQPIPPEGWRYDEGTGTFFNPEANRSSERSLLYTESEKYISKCDEKIALNISASEWAVKRMECYTYKDAVRRTTEQASYPDYVEYPAKPAWWTE